MAEPATLSLLPAVTGDSYASMSPHLPITPEKSPHAIGAAEAGAILHLHARNPDNGRIAAARLPGFHA
jgi:uncharacterized protein (DUF849 family)